MALSVSTDLICEALIAHFQSLEAAYFNLHGKGLFDTNPRNTGWLTSFPNLRSLEVSHVLAARYSVKGRSWFDRSLWNCSKLEQIQLNGFSPMHSGDDTIFCVTGYHGKLDDSDSEYGSDVSMGASQVEKKECDPDTGGPPSSPSRRQGYFLTRIPFPVGSMWTTRKTASH